MRRTRSLTAAVTAAVALSALSACSATGSAGTADAAKAPTLSVADAMSLATKSTGGYHSVRFTAVLGTPKDKATVTGRIGWKPLAENLTLASSSAAAGPSTVKLLFSGDTVFMDSSSPELSQVNGKHWLRMDLKGLGADSQGLTDMLNQAGGQDPATQLTILTSAKGVRRVGTETVDGRSTAHYQGSVDIAAVAAGEDAALKKLLTTVGHEGIDSEKVDLWVGADNLPVRIVTSATSSEGPFTSTVDYSDYSAAPLTITPPPASDIYSFADMIKTLGAGS